MATKSILPFLATVSLVSLGAAMSWIQSSPEFTSVTGTPSLLVTTQPTATPTPTVSPNGTEQPLASEEEYDDFAPGLLIGVLMFFIIILAILGAGMVIASVVIGGLAFLTLLGIVSSSALVGFIQRRPGPALSAFLAQLCAVIGIFCGVIIAWIVLFLMEWPLNFWLVTSVGAISGLIGGAGVGLLAGLVLRRVYSWGMERIKARRNRGMADGSKQDTQ